MRNRRYRPRPLFSNPVPRAVEKPKMKWKVLPILWLALKRAAMVLGFVFMGSFLLSMCVAGVALQGAGPQGLPDEIVLTLDFREGLSDVQAPPAFADPFAPSKPTVREIVDSIQAARTDFRVKGILARMDLGGFSLAHIQEIRAALKGFQESGKFTKIYSSSYGDGGGGVGRYYLASAFDEIWMQPLGVISIPGIDAKMPFMRSLLDTLGIRPQFFQRHEYKTAYESLTNSEISPANREELSGLVVDLRQVLTGEIAADREMSVNEFTKLVDQALFTADEALENGLVDRLDYADVLLDQVLMDVSGKVYADFADDERLPLVSVEAYYADLQTRLPQPGLMAGRKPKIALVHVNGAIMQANGEVQGIADSSVIAPAILDAADDEDVRAIVVRVDSPGGSPTASESILRALDKAKEKGKSVIVSMGPTAASGGYWVAAKADYIFALPLTITGSIGVVGGKFALDQMMAKIGVNWDGVKWGRNAGMWSPIDPFSASEAQQVNAMLDHVYEAFVARVAEGREMSAEEVHAIAKGRVWSGSKAVEIGLADELGGLNEAIEYAMNQHGIAARNRMILQQFPEPKTPFEQFVELLGGQVRAGQVIGAQAQFLEFLGPALQDAAVLKDLGAYQVYDPVWVE